jgi:hypothetical protein
MKDLTYQKFNLVEMILELGLRYQYGKKNLRKWRNIINYYSYNTLTRYLVWKETGMLPVGTNLNNRIKILKKEGIKIPHHGPEGIRTLDLSVSSRKTLVDPEFLR